MVTRRQFSHEFKIEAVKLMAERGVSTAQASRDIGVHESRLRAWKRELTANPEQAEIERLRKEVAKLKMERDILKKAVAYFAKESL